MNKIHLKKIHIFFISVALILLALGASQIRGTQLRSEFLGTCGDFTCDANSGEDKLTCSQDCGSVICGDGICELDENQNTCTPDCGGMITMCEGDDCFSAEEGVQISQEELQKYLEGIVIPGGASGSLETSIYTTAAREYILQSQNTLGAVGPILWEENPNMKYIGPYCPLTVYETGMAQSTINFMVSLMSESEKNKYLNAIYPGVSIKANWSNMYGGKIEEKCVPCNNGSYHQNPCRLCPSGKVLRSGGCEERNPVIPDSVKEYCGDKIVQENEQCDDGNALDGDGCSATCKKEATISGPSSISEVEASGPATYQVDLQSDDPELQITSVTVTSVVPKNSPQINAGGTNMTWELQKITNNNKSAIIISNDYKWYGTTGDELCYDSSKQSTYDITVQATLSNGTTAKHTFEMEVKFSGGVHDTGVVIDNFSATTKKGVTDPNNFSITKKWFKKIMYTDCVRGDQLDMHISLGKHIEVNGQYRKYIEIEEDFHHQQISGGLDWSQGGWAGVEDAIEEKIQSREWCGTGSTPEEAEEKATLKFRAFRETMLKTLQNMGQSVELRCYMEETAKNEAKLTSEVGGLHLECAYKMCKPGDKPKISPIEAINMEFVAGI